MYHHYLDIHIRRQLGNVSMEEQKSSSDYASLISNGKENCLDNEKLQELMLCKTMYIFFYTYCNIVIIKCI